MLGKSAFVPHEMKTSIIRITSYKNKNCRGVLVNPYFGKEVRFDNALQLLFTIEGMLDELNYPARVMEPRTFTDATNAASTSVRTSQEDTVATFKVNVLFRQNASWQGNVVWVEKGIESAFRSTFELLQLMDVSAQ